MIALIYLFICFVNTATKTEQIISMMNWNSSTSKLNQYFIFSSSDGVFLAEANTANKSKHCGINTKNKVKKMKLISYQTMPVGPPAPRWLDQSLQASPQLPTSYWPAAGSLAATHTDKLFFRIIS